MISHQLFKQRGFSLIEALVAFLILSVGMLGIASLQLISLKAGRTAEFRTVAVIKAEEILERIRVNQESVMSYVVDATDAGDDNGCSDSNSAALCTGAEMARGDIFSWKLDLGKSLIHANAEATIDVVAPVPGVLPAAIVTVAIVWRERNPETQAMDDVGYSVSSHVCATTTC